MPLYIPWLTETIKKRGVRYLLHHYLGQFFEEKLTLEQLSIDIYEGRGSIRNLALDVDGLNDELDFIPFKFLEGCVIGQISVEVPWSSLASDACRVELDGAQFFCRLKTSADANKPYCTESTLLSRSLMTSSMQMAEEIVTTEDDDDLDARYTQPATNSTSDSTPIVKGKDASQMFEGLEMFAQLIDSVLRRTKLTARNTLFQIQPHQDNRNTKEEAYHHTEHHTNVSSSRSSGDEFSEPMAKSNLGSADENDDDYDDVSVNDQTSASYQSSSTSTVEFFIKFFRCEEMIDETKSDREMGMSTNDEHELANKSCAIPETITKLLTLEDVEMRIDGIPVSNLIGKHTITIKFNGQKSEISIFSSSPLLAVISHKQLETFFNVFDGSKGLDMNSSSIVDGDQKLMSQEDYAKIENQLLETANLRNMTSNETRSGGGGGVFLTSDDSGSSFRKPYFASSQIGSGTGGRRWVESGDLYSDSIQAREAQEFDYHLPNSSTCSGPSTKTMRQSSETTNEPTLDHIEAFSCELKLPGIWLCILRDGEALPPLIKPYADSINSFQIINKYIDEHIKVPHIRCLALKVALDITAAGTNIFLGDLDISEHLIDIGRMSPVMRLLHSEPTNVPMSSSKFKASISKGKEITVELLTKTRLLFDPTIVDRIVYEYKLMKFKRESQTSANAPQLVVSDDDVLVSARRASQVLILQQQQQRLNQQPELNLKIRGEHFKIELLCPIPDLTPEAQSKRPQLRPQSFIFDFKDIILTWQSDKLKISSSELLAFVKTQPKQNDSEAVKFIESTNRGSDKISLILEPSPSNLDNAFTNDIEQALNESSMYDSIYVGQATESKIPTNPFQTKRKVVRASFSSQQQQQSHKSSDGVQSSSGKSRKINECDHEKILTPGDRQHLLDYLNQTLTSTKLSLNLHLPICEVEFEDKEQLDLIYNRFGNDFVFWQPKAFSKDQNKNKKVVKDKAGGLEFRNQPETYEDDDRSVADDTCADSDSSFHSASYNRRIGGDNNLDDMTTCYDNEVTCKIIVDELVVRFNHQSCAAALKQEIAANNFLMGIIIDVNRKPNTLLSLVADNLELSTDLETVLEGNFFGDKNSIFSLTAEIKRPTKALKDIKMAIQLRNGLFSDFRSETYTRFWQSINVTDEPILGYTAPQIIVELHIDILNTGLMLVRDGARPALLSIDELYLTSMVMEKTSQVMIRMIADEVSLYIKRDRRGLEVMKNYICLVDSGLIDLDVRIGRDGRLEFNVINNVITVRVCQDSLNALCKLFDVLIMRNNVNKQTSACERAPDGGSQTMQDSDETESLSERIRSSNIDDGFVEQLIGLEAAHGKSQQRSQSDDNGILTNELNIRNEPKARGSISREMDLLVDAMNDYNASSSSSNNMNSLHNDSGVTNTYAASGDMHKRQCDARGNDTDSITSSNEDKNNERHSQDVAPVFQRAYSSSPVSTSVYSSSSTATSNDDEDENDDDDDNDGDDDDDDENDYDEQNQDHEGSDGDAGAHDANQQGRRMQRDPNACLLDESNPMLGDLFSPPLLPLGSTSSMSSPSSSLPMPQVGDNELEEETVSLNNSSFDTHYAMDESGFFVIGDDDVGAGIIDNKKQHEPLVRKLIDGPINIVENHFKMTKPRTIPDMLATCIERYVLEEMTLVVNIFGGHDFDDEPHQSSSKGSATDETSSSPTPLDSVDLASETNANSELLDTIGTGSQTIRSRAGSMAASGTRRQQSGELDSGGSGSMKRVRAGQRRKHLSEGSGQGSNSRYDHKSVCGLEQRVRFGEGAVNLWESLDLMSSPDFLGARPRPSQAPINSDSKQVGGTWRQNDVCIQLTLSKVKLLYEVADCTKVSQAPCAMTESMKVPPISWRFLLFIQDIEVKDRIAASDINKMLYEYCTESMPKRSTQMLTIRNTATINPSDSCEECNLRVSLKPLRLNIDQDTLLFLIEFFTAFCKSITKQQQQQQQNPIYTSGTKLQTSVSMNSSGQARSNANCSATTVATNPRKQVATGAGSSSSSSSCSLSAPVEGVTPHGSRRGTAHTTPASENNNKQAGKSAAGAPGDNTALSNKKALQAKRNSKSSGKQKRATTSSRDSLDDANHGREAVTAASSLSTSRQCSGQNNNAKRTNNGSQCSTTTTTTTTLYADTHPPIIDDGPPSSLPTHCHTDNSSGSANHAPVYIKSFTFSPDVPIRIDYHAKHLDFEQGALAGILMGLAHLDHSELVLRRVQAKHGMRGLDRVLVFVLNSWLSDIKRNQLPSILGGVGPMHSVIQLFQGMRDLFWMPIDHYRKDGRLVRGLQRGATSFSSSTAMAAIDLVNRFISIVQCTAQIAHDIVTPPTSISSSPSLASRRFKPSTTASGASGHGSPGSRVAGSRRHRHSMRHQSDMSIRGPRLASHSQSVRLSASGAGTTTNCGLNQPRNFCEGVAVGFTIIKEGFNDAARNVTVGMQAEDMRSAVGELVRQIPSTLLNPIISATEGAQSVLVGIRNQIAPDARREDHDKWKGRVRGK